MTRGNLLSSSRNVTSSLFLPLLTDWAAMPRTKPSLLMSHDLKTHRCKFRSCRRHEGLLARWHIVTLTQRYDSLQRDPWPIATLLAPYFQAFEQYRAQFVPCFGIMKKHLLLLVLGTSRQQRRVGYNACWNTHKAP